LPKQKSEELTLRKKIFATGKTGTIGKCLGKSATGLELDLLKVSKCKEDLGESILIHLASIIKPDEIKYDRRLAEVVNVDGTLQLAEKALADGCTRFVFASTSHVYASKKSSIKEYDSISPSSEYARQKREAEIGLLRIFSKDLSRLLIMRIFSVLGLSMKEYTLGGTANRILRGEKNILIRNSSDIRDFMTPEQVARAILSISKNEKISEPILNLCTGRPSTVKHAVSLLLREQLREDLDTHFLPGFSKVPALVGDNSLLRKYITIESKFMLNT
jgi:nucleoside-diphosphate-sugar epimerase